MRPGESFGTDCESRPPSSGSREPTAARDGRATPSLLEVERLLREVAGNGEKFELLGPLGSGGMGHVYKARHVRMDRLCALKVIRPERLANAVAVQRFERESKAIARLKNEHIIHAYDAYQEGGMWFLVTEFVEGDTLDHLVALWGPPPVVVACELIRQAAVGLQHAHECGMVHRDVKPSNLILVAGGRGLAPAGWPPDPLIKVLDFGLALLDDTDEPDAPGPLTRDGFVVGTPEYMAPEQARHSRNIDVRADIYSLGCTLYFLLTGRPPFTAETSHEVMVKHLKDLPEPLQNGRPDVPPALAAVAERMLAKRPEDRYPEPKDVVAALRPWCGAAAAGGQGAVPVAALAPTTSLAAAAAVPVPMADTLDQNRATARACSETLPEAPSAERPSLLRRVAAGVRNLVHGVLAWLFLVALVTVLGLLLIYALDPKPFHDNLHHLLEEAKQLIPD